MESYVKERIKELVNNCFNGLEEVNCFNEDRKDLIVNEIKDKKCNLELYKDYKRIDLFNSNNFFEIVNKGDSFKNGVKYKLKDSDKIKNLCNDIKELLDCEEVVFDFNCKWCGRFMEEYYMILYK